MAGNEQVNLIVGALDNIDDGAGNAGALIIQASGKPPINTTMVLTPWRRSWGTKALTVSASSLSSLRCHGVTMLGVPSSVMPMKAILVTGKRANSVGREQRLAGLSLMTLAADSGSARR